MLEWWLSCREGWFGFGLGMPSGTWIDCLVFNWGIFATDGWGSLMELLRPFCSCFVLIVGSNLLNESWLPVRHPKGRQTVFEEWGLFSWPAKIRLELGRWQVFLLLREIRGQHFAGFSLSIHRFLHLRKACPSKSYKSSCDIRCIWGSQLHDRTRLRGGTFGTWELCSFLLWLSLKFRWSATWLFRGHFCWSMSCWSLRREGLTWFCRSRVWILSSFSRLSLECWKWLLMRVWEVSWSIWKQSEVSRDSWCLERSVSCHKCQ